MHKFTPKISPRLARASARQLIVDLKEIVQTRDQIMRSHCYDADMAVAMVDDLNRLETEVGNTLCGMGYTFPEYAQS